MVRVGIRRRRRSFCWTSNELIAPIEASLSEWICKLKLSGNIASVRAIACSSAGYTPCVQVMLAPTSVAPPTCAGCSNFSSDGTVAKFESNH
jgi:hypothetical protein